MIRHLRIAILPLIAVLMSAPHGMAANIAIQVQISTNPVAVPLLIRMADAGTQECRRQCDADYHACMAEVPEFKNRGVPSAELEKYVQACSNEHYACYRNC